MRLFRRFGALCLLLAVMALLHMGVSPPTAQSVGPDDLIRAIVLEKNQVCSGEDFWIVVRAVHPDDPKQEVDISIDGRTGNTQRLQFNGAPATRVISVSASTPEGHAESTLVEVEVIECDPGVVHPVVYVRPNPYHPLTVDFEVANVDELGLDAPVYHWDFGDGQSDQTEVRYASHYYGDSLILDQPNTTFEVELRRPRPSQEDLSTWKTVTVWNMYYFNKQRGFIQPPVETSGQLRAILMPGNVTILEGDYVVRNLEPEPIQVTSTVREFQYCDPARDSTSTEIGPWIGTIEGNQDIARSFLIAPSEIPDDACGLVYHVSGQTPSGLDAFFNLNFELLENTLMAESVTDPNTLALLTGIAEQGLVDDPYLITEEDLYRLEREGKIDRSLVLVNRSTETDQTNPGPIISLDVVGDECQPGDPPPRDGVSCQATDETTMSLPYVKNAKKGDILVSASCGLTGNLLRQVFPPQKYSHVGIMTKNYYEVRHSLPSDKRYRDYPEGVFDEPTDGIRPDVLKYGWPGVITQTIGEAFEGRHYPDPESGKLYSIRGFNPDPARCTAVEDIVYPLVVKPPPEWENATRPTLHDVADKALEIDGHYRFYHYSNSAGVLDPAENAPADAGWAAGTRSSVCSSFIWGALKELGIELEGDLEAEDVVQGAQVDAQTQDGLYFYTEGERRAAGHWLYSHVYNMAYEEADWYEAPLVWLSDMADDIANQMTNCFASDWCEEDAKDSDAWKNPGVGRAVSPENILFWDAPPTGVYGYNEPLVYRTGRYHLVYRWLPTAGTGTVRGRVFSESAPVNNATVTVIGPDLVQQTTASGEFEFLAVPAGQYEVEATKWIDGGLHSDRKLVVVAADQITTVDLNLQPPPNWFRLVTIDGWMFILDDELEQDDETGTFDFYRTARLDPSHLSTDIHIEECVGDEVRVEIDFDLRLLSDKTSVYADVTARLYEGTSCDTDDHEDTETANLTVPEDQSRYLDEPIHLYNDESLGGDYADIEFIVTNGRQP